MSVILFILFGLVVGVLARAIMPGRQSMSLLMTAVLGMIGSLIGGFIGALVSPNRHVTGLNTAGLIGSVIGALIVLFVYTRVAARKTASRRP